MSGWHPDPTGRFEHRFHNGELWTADVSSGGQRFVDPLPIEPPNRPGNGLALAGMVCGIVGLTIAWIPFIAFLGLVTAIVGLVCSLIGLSRSRPSGSGRGFAITGIVTSSLGVLAGVLGIVLTFLAFFAIGRYEDAGPNDATITDCQSEGGLVTVTGRLTNLSDEQRSYSVLVTLGLTSVDDRDRVIVDDVPAGETVDFTLESRVDRSRAEPRCSILSVDGPLPFGIDPELFD